MSESIVKNRIEKITNRDIKNAGKYLNLDSGRFNKPESKSKFKYVNDKLGILSNDEILFNAVLNYKPATLTAKPIVINSNKLENKSNNLRTNATPRPLVAKPAKRTQTLDGKVWQMHSKEMQSTCFTCPKLIGRDEIRGSNGEIKVERFIQGHIRPQKYFKPGEELLRDHEDNIKPLCKECNLEMGKEHMFEYMLRKYDELRNLTSINQEIKLHIAHLNNAIKSLAKDKRMLICKESYIKCSIAISILKIYYNQELISLQDYKYLIKELSAKESEPILRINKATEIISKSIS